MHIKYLKFYSALGLAFFFTIASSAQLPAGTQPNTKLPVVKPKVLTPPDLLVTGFNLISCTRDNATKKLIITVSVTIKNNGQMRAVASNLQGYFQSPAGTATSRPISETARVAEINPGASVTAQYVFRRPFSSDAGYTLVPFDFWVRADAFRVISESDEGNNGSSSIRITPPTR